MAALDRELRTWERERTRLFAESPGKFVLIHGDDVIGVYESQNDAINEGWKQFPGEPILAKRIVEVELPVYIPHVVG